VDFRTTLVKSQEQEKQTRKAEYWRSLGYLEIKKTETTSLDFLDVAQGVSWSDTDYPSIRKIYDLINFYQKKRMHVEKYLLINSFEQQLDRHWNDQTMHEIPEPIFQTLKFDRVLNSGRTLAAELITGQRGDRFDYLALGTSQVPVTDADFRLYNEILRVNVVGNGGYISAAGAIIKHSGLMSPGETSMLVYEIGFVNMAVFDPEQMLWNRSVFPPNKGVDHNQNEDFFSITHSVYTSSSE